MPNVHPPGGGAGQRLVEPAAGRHLHHGVRQVEHQSINQSIWKNFKARLLLTGLQ